MDADFLEQLRRCSDCHQRGKSGHSGYIVCAIRSQGKAGRYRQNRDVNCYLYIPVYQRCDWAGTAYRYDQGIQHKCTGVRWNGAGADSTGIAGEAGTGLCGQRAYRCSDRGKLSCRE